MTSPYEIRCPACMFKGDVTPSFKVDIIDASYFDALRKKSEKKDDKKEGDKKEGEKKKGEKKEKKKGGKKKPESPYVEEEGVNGDFQKANLVVSRHST
eukprot:GABW01004094.1.p1 GENE.GABW01004094.1~~GABW01004094.1.p1  ORF type:complete len:98 (-),score=58.42 GABW01004094.1:3-296(-)